MYGFVYAVEDGFALVRPFFEEELVEISGTEEQIEDIRTVLEEREAAQEYVPVVVMYDAENMMLLAEEKGAFYGPLAE